jgi:hypothetical protein
MARVVCDARCDGGDEEIRRCRTRVLAPRIEWLIDDQFVSAHSDTVAIAAEAGDCEFHDISRIDDLAAGGLLVELAHGELLAERSRQLVCVG